MAVQQALAVLADTGPSSAPVITFKRNAFQIVLFQYQSCSQAVLNCCSILKKSLQIRLTLGMNCSSSPAPTFANLQMFSASSEGTMTAIVGRHAKTANDPELIVLSAPTSPTSCVSCTTEFKVLLKLCNMRISTIHRIKVGDTNDKETPYPPSGEITPLTDWSIFGEDPQLTHLRRLRRLLKKQIHVPLNNHLKWNTFAFKGKENINAMSSRIPKAGKLVIDDCSSRDHVEQLCFV
ncbi:hypothetical protein OPV22_013245 [Ensete ventricosum]|uniref:Uncharacterized protein n=1 Tax=Ensete ventricosum TaxID=4639 RepID=A0AAV8PMR4_ENSVE|nr:hypothetical protein OPV22_013245 [Ensete ventricosum]